MEYDYVPISQREPLHWPDGNRVALILTINLETWDLVKNSVRPYYAGGPAILPDALPGNVPDFPNYSWREYGQRVGLWRMIELLDHLGVRASCTVNGATCERRKAMVDAAVERDWEILAHNYEQGELLTDYAHDPEAEREVIRNTLRAYEMAVGRPARGWLSSSLRGTLNTPAILAAEGLLFYCDLMNDDQPYLIRTANGPLVAVPYSNEINDFTLLTRNGYTTDEYRDVLIEELSTLHREGARTARLMNVGLHPHVTGRAYRIRALREFLEYARSLDGVWWPTREEVATWFLER
jgi:allantoinase